MKAVEHSSKSNASRSDGSPWLRPSVYEPRRARTVRLLKLSVGALRKERKGISLPAIAAKSKELDPEGRGVSQSAIQRNEEAKAYYEKNRSWKRRRSLPNVKTGKESPVHIKVDRNEARARQRYKRLTKCELIDRLVTVEHAYAEREEIWLQSSEEGLLWQLRAEEGEITAQADKKIDSDKSQGPTLTPYRPDGKQLHSAEHSKDIVQPSDTTERHSINYFNFFSEVEETFIRRRGHSLWLSPLDWALMESWKEKGVPIHIVLRAIDKVFDAHEARRQRRSIKSLLYCREEVEAQYAEWLQAQVGSGTESVRSEAVVEKSSANSDSDLPFTRATIIQHIAHCQDALLRIEFEDRKGLPQRVIKTLTGVSSDLQELGRDFAKGGYVDAEQLEVRLTKLEARLDKALLSHLQPERLTQQKRDAEQQLRPYRGLIENATYEQMFDRLLLKLLREDIGIPRLSLYHL